MGSIKEIGQNLKMAWIGALGYKTTKIFIDRGSKRQRIVLARSNGLLVKVGSLPNGIKATAIILSGPRALLPSSFTFEMSSSLEDRDRFSLSQGESDIEIIFSRNQRGEFALEDLVDGIPFEIKAVDIHEQLIATAKCSGLFKEETKVVQLSFDSNEMTLQRFELVDESGRPLKNARVKEIDMDNPKTFFVDDGKVTLIYYRSKQPGALQFECADFESIQIPFSPSNFAPAIIRMRRAHE